MNEELRNIIKQLRNIDQEKRCEWLISTYPPDNENYYFAFQIIPHFSWSKKDRAILMQNYLKKLSFASEKPYLIFLKIMPLNEFLTLLKAILLKSETKDLDLLKYHLNREFTYNENIKNNEQNKQLSDNFILFLNEYCKINKIK